MENCIHTRMVLIVNDPILVILSRLRLWYFTIVYAKQRPRESTMNRYLRIFFSIRREQKIVVNHRTKVIVKSA
jgi:hypothetical protein